MSFDDAIKMMAIYSSNKGNDPNSVGEKGVGLKFVYFQSNYFELITTQSANATRIIIKDAKTWKNEIKETNLELEAEEIQSNKIGTIIIIKGIENDELFSMSIEQFEYIIRTRTAIGDTNFIWNDKNTPIELELNIISPDGEKYSKIIENKYWLPTDVYDKKKSVLDVDDFEQQCGGSAVTDKEKSAMMKDKIIEYKKECDRFKIYMCFVQKLSIWNDINEKCKLIDKNSDLIYGTLKEDTKVFHGGVFISTKGMPTGISIIPPSAGKAGYWNNTFILIQDNTIKFDIGRKSIDGRTTKRYNEEIKNVFNKITNLFIQFGSRNNVPLIDLYQSFDKAKIQREIDNMLDINSNYVIFKKTPTDQEASVCAIFYEMIGAKILNGIIPITSKYKEKYDLFADVGGHLSVFEFKSHLRNIIDDFDEIIKIFNELDYIVCWDVNDDDRKALKKEGITLIDLTTNKSELSETKIPLDSVTHIMQIQQYVKPVMIIDLKKYLELIETNIC